MTCGTSSANICSASLPTLYPSLPPSPRSVFNISQPLPTSHMLSPHVTMTADATFPWDWDLGREQDLLFQSLWNDGGLGGGGDSNIMGTLLGDNFGTGEFGGEF